MVLVNRTSVDTVDAEQLELVLTVKGNEIVMHQTLLRNFVFVADPIQLQTGAEVLLATLKGLNVFCMVLLQQNGGLGG